MTAGLVAEADFGVAEPTPLRNQDLAFDDIVAGDLFGDGVLDLDARVDLDEVKIAAVGVHEKFDGGGVVQADGAADGQGGVEDAPAQGRVETGGGGDFDDLLMAPLNGTIALEKVNETAVLVAEQLDLDVAGAADELFDENLGGAEGGAGLAAGLIQGVVELVSRQGDAHPTAAAAHRRLDDDRVAEPLGEDAALVIRFHGLVAAGEDGDAGLLGDVAGRDLVAELFEDFRLGADKDQAGFTDGAGEMGVFGEEAVAGVNGVHVVFSGEGDDGGNVEVGTDGFAGSADAVGLVGLEAVQGEAVLVGV